MNKFKFILFVAFFVVISLRYGDNIRGIFTKNATGFLSGYLEIKTAIEDKINEHFNQQKEIKELRERNRHLENSAEVLNAFASKLNDMLKLNGVKEEYAPKVQLIRSVSYANLNDYYKVWVDFKDFNSSKIYGLLNHGSSAGIVVQKDGNPLALLLGDPKSIFSVFVGENKIPGVIMGKQKEVRVTYMPLWMSPKVGDEVITSGLDGIFFKGVPVGIVTKVINEELSKTAVIKPYSTIDVPSYYHIIKKN